MKTDTEKTESGAENSQPPRAVVAITVDAEQKIVSIPALRRSVGRELGMRRNVYPNWVKRNRMKQDEADRELRAMEYLYALLKSMEEFCQESGLEVFGYSGGDVVTIGGRKFGFDALRAMCEPTPPGVAFRFAAIDEVVTVERVQVAAP